MLKFEIRERLKFDIVIYLEIQFPTEYEIFKKKINFYKYIRGRLICLYEEEIRFHQLNYMVS
jgi:hypothetical protein